MSPISFIDCKRIVEKTYMNIGAYTTDARNVTMMIIAHESGQGKHRRQIGAARPALGLGQMEEPTFDSVVKYSDRIKAYLNRAGYDINKVKFTDLETDDVLAIIFIRARLAMDINPLPVTPKAQAEFCKVFWNAGGKATPEKYLNDWEQWRNGN